MNDHSSKRAAPERRAARTPRHHGGEGSRDMGLLCEPDPSFNASASWFALTLRQRWRICRLAGVPDAFHVAQQRYGLLTDAERELIARAVKDYMLELPEAAWGLAA